MNKYNTNNLSYERKRNRYTVLIQWAQGIAFAAVFLFVLGWLDGMNAKHDIQVAEHVPHGECKVGEMRFYCKDGGK